jgi:hypothetical protein
LIKFHATTDGAGLADHDAGAVVNEEAGADLRTGMDGNAYLISSPQIIAYGSDLYPQYPVYYNYGGKYYQTDGVVTDPVTWKQVHGERLIYGKPPYYYRR